MNEHWRFYDYISDIGTNHVAKWVEKELSVQEASDLDALLDILSKETIWSEKVYKTLANYQGLGEIRWKGDSRRQLRLIGIRSAEERSFTCLIGCSHKDNIYSPAACFETAVSRKKALDRGEGSLCER